MKQLLQNYKTGELILAEVPAPLCRGSGVLVRNAASLVSAGTERQMIELAKRSLLGKAKARPDLVKQVISKIKTDGLFETYRQVMARLDSPMPLGYSSAGVVVEVGGIGGRRQEAGDRKVGGIIKVGDRVACVGSGYACHAEVISVPKNLCVKIPASVSFEEASFVALGGIALHTVRIAQVQLGERVAVIGLGLLGQLLVQILKASGCFVLGFDIDAHKVSLAREHGADAVGVIGQDDVVSISSTFSDGLGLDTAIIMASTPSNEPLELAAEIVREKGKVIAPGLVGLKIPRKLFYEKELDFQIPRAWGPGMYDEDYEKGKVDYPKPYVRWTARENMRAFLELLAQGKVRVDRLITHRFPIDRALEAYELLIGKRKERYIGVILTYGREERPIERKIWVEETGSRRQETGEKGKVRLGVIGAGTFARSTLLPILRKMEDVELRGIATATGISGYNVGRKFRFAYTTTDYKEILDDPDIDVVVIATRHNLHAQMVIEALEKGKHVFVEKPLAINEEELRQVIDAYCRVKEHGSEGAGEQGSRGAEGKSSPQHPSSSAPLPILMVGFNRRFSPLVLKMKEFLSFSREPMVIQYRVNAGYVPRDSWIQTEEGGDRIVGEICHFVDLIEYLTEALPERVQVQSISGQSERYLSSDNLIVQIKMSDGSVASILYSAMGDKAFPRERVEIFRDGSVCLLDNFRKLEFLKGGKKKSVKKSGIQWGHREELRTFFECIMEGKSLPLDIQEYIATTLATFAIREAMVKGEPVKAGVWVQRH